MSQREKDFKGGIQAGTTAFDDDSKRLDVYLKECRDEITLEGMNKVNQFNEQMKMELVGDNCFGFAPDGGAWFKDGKLVAVFEAKKQGRQGNAYERWWDNASTARFINPDVKYVTFCTGAGAAVNECLDKLRRKAQRMFGENFIFHNQVEPFTKRQVCDIMRDVLEGIE